MMIVFLDEVMKHYILFAKTQKALCFDALIVFSMLENIYLVSGPAQWILGKGLNLIEFNSGSATCTFTLFQHTQKCFLLLV
jgi:hypothetical protein